MLTDIGFRIDVTRTLFRGTIYETNEINLYGETKGL